MISLFVSATYTLHLTMSSGEHLSYLLNLVRAIGYLIQIIDIQQILKDLCQSFARMLKLGLIVENGPKSTVLSRLLPAGPFIHEYTY